MKAELCVMVVNVKLDAAFVAPVSWLRIALAFPRVPLCLRPSDARANLFAGD
ncbi:MAG TPA: hypothetical protein VFM10_10525 [Terriglobales bacterium]|nr:hypothetical protein [Terriglobales bacterium]